MAKQDKRQPVPKKGLHTDTSYLNQPLGALTFALNVVNESEVGDDGWRSNEQSNEECFVAPEGFIPIGQTYLGKHQTLIFSAKEDGTLSEIGITDANCVYTTLVRANLGFKVENQISSTYRLRRGCERTVYFSTPAPMIFNLDKPEDFKTNGQWDINKFKLFKVYEMIPNFESVETLENGALIPGSYNAAIQYLDEDLNPTEWITTSEPIKIYNDSTSKDYHRIRGATSIEDAVANFGVTNKSIKFNFTNFDPSYAFYRVAIIEAVSGNGLVSGVNFSAPISTNVKSFTYSGVSSSITVGTEEEIIAFNSIIEQVGFVEQIENRLILSEVKGSQINFCKLQKYASRIQSQLSLRNVTLNVIGTSNPKTETVNFDGTGYMPGEIYSFGIVYIFADSTLSPVFHIPGKADEYSSLMSNNNKAQDVVYQDISCSDYWGVDSEGEILKDTPLRHHRFPTRSEIAEPLYTQIKDADPFDLNYFTLDIQGIISSGTLITYKVDYLIDGIPFSYQNTILAASYDPLVGVQKTITTTRGVITGIVVTEDVDGGGFDPITEGVASPVTALVYQSDITSQEIDSEVSFFTSNIMGITFQGIDIPSVEDTNGKEVVGYYIVRNERTEDSKTILDTGIITPMLIERGFVAHGHLMPTLSDTDRIDKDIFALIHPEHRFNGREYKNLTNITQEGEYRITSQAKSSVLTQDVGAGTSYNPDIHKGSSDDYDGFSLHTLTRDTEVFLKQKAREFLSPFTRGEVFYLNALNSKVVTDTDDVRQEVYNVSGDNKVGIIQMEEDIPSVDDVYNKLPYVVLKRTLANPYGNFRVLSYYKENRNPIYFDTDDIDPVTNGNRAFILNGDSYITPMRVHSSMFNDFKIKKRSTKSGTWTIILGALLVVAGVAAAIFTAGTSLALVGLGAGLAAAGLGISSVSSGVETNQISKVYEEIYEAGLRDTIQDDDTEEVFGPTQEDDEFQWLGDTLTNVWFESGVNMALRNGTTIAITDFLDSPVARENPGIFNGNDASDAPVNTLDSYMLEKLTVIDTDNEDGRLYKGYAGAELYLLNDDYKRTNKQKIFFALGLEYDCCSDCIEDFPHRNHYSEQSFQEELTDNYRAFLPNNYRDIEGEKGRITDVFRMKNNLYIHTVGALWHLPQNIQERVTGDVVSFIGTGDFFSIPPRKINDADKESAGTLHNWARMKTANGVFFISETEGKIYLFDGNSLQPIVTGNENWFKDNIPVQADYDYLITAGVPYPLANNPSNKYGTGFISAYDTNKERFILTKKDFIFSDRIIGSEDYTVCTDDGNFIIFDDFSVTIQDRANDGWEYVGLEDCKLKFSKVELEEEEQIRQVITTIPSDAHVHYFLDTSGSFGGANDSCLTSIRVAVEAWHTSLGVTNVQLIEHTDSTERWVNYAQAISASYPIGTNLSELDIIVISFCNEAQPIYHGSSLSGSIDAPTSTFIDDYDNFTGSDIGGNNPSNFSLYNSFNSFFGIHYPIVFGTDGADCDTGGGSIPASKEFLLHSIAALEGDSLSLEEASAILTPQNLGFTIGEWDTVSTALQGANPYPTGLKNFGWVGKWDRNSVIGEPVIDEEEFEADITELLKDNIVIEDVVVIVDVAVTVIEYEEGVIVEEPVEHDLSWTMSYSLKDSEWVSWHSYLPNFYFYRLEEFYSWKHGDANVWKHNAENSYQKFYGTRFPHILEYVDNKRPKETKLWDYVELQTIATEFNSTYQDDVDRDITFNKLIAYTSKQNTGLLNLIPKIDGMDYLNNQVTNAIGSIPIDRNERNWTLNDLRDVVIDYNIPMFRKDNVSVKPEYYIDKVLNTDALDYNKEWYDLQSFRDKYLVLRLIFDNFDNIRLVTNFTEEIDNTSHR